MIHVVKFLIVLHVWYFTYHSGQLEHDQEVIWHTFQITITKQIEYILLSHTFTEKECTKIFAPPSS